MENNKFIVIIPARFASTRFPGKPLAMLGGSTVIRRVYEQAEKAIDNVIVATDDERIFNHVNSFGKAVMTGSHHRSGTDRCWEAYQINGGNEDIIINVQGDEPFIQPDQIKAIMQCFDDATTDIATLIKPFDQQGSYTDLEDSNKVKVVTDINMNALYFSRSVIPHLRGIEKELWPSRHQYYTHLGMYAYRASVLQKITQLQPSSLEISESLEQLRWLENGLKIKVGITQHSSIGIVDLDRIVSSSRRAEQFLSKQS